jgi:hypothetical protein
LDLRETNLQLVYLVQSFARESALFIFPFLNNGHSRTPSPSPR